MWFISFPAYAPEASFVVACGRLWSPHLGPREARYVLRLGLDVPTLRVAGFDIYQELTARS